MSKQVWICEKCLSLWTDQDAAKKCEARHLEPISVEPLEYPQWSYGTDQRFPQRVLVKIDSKPTLGWDYATYVLERIGPKGV